MRRKWYQRLLALTLTLTVVFGTPSLADTQDHQAKVQAATEQNQSLEKKASQKAQSLIGMYGATSVQYALMRDGELVLSNAKGMDDVKKKTLATTDQVYCVASISKMYTTTAVMQLVEQGKIDLDAPVTRYVTDFKMADERYKDITVRMLLNHSSGLMGGQLANALLFEDNDTYYHDSLLKKLKSERLKADPGAFSVYCNDGFVLAEIVVERVSGMSFTKYIEEKICKPLGLSHTKTPVSLTAKDKIAGMYLKKGGTKLPSEYANCIGTAGVYATAEDLCRFGMIFFDGNNELLSEESKKATRVTEGRNGRWLSGETGLLDYGLGWDSVSVYPFSEYGISAMEKGGDSLLCHGELVVLPEYKLSVAVLTSGASSGADAILAHYLAEEYLKEQGLLKEKELVTKFSTEKAKVPAEIKEKFSGYYTGMYRSYKVTINDEGLEYYELSNPNQKLKFSYTTDGYFVFSTGAERLSFVTEDGIDYLIDEQYSTAPGMGTVYSKMYAGQKTPENPLSKKVKAAWKARDNKNYLILDEKYTSLLYQMEMPCMQPKASDNQPGYMYGDKIVDENNAVFFTTMPQNMSRSMIDYKFKKDKNGTEYLLHADGSKWAICEDSVGKLSTKASYKVSIGKEKGYAKWYKVGKKSAGKTMTATLGKNQKGTVAVYDKDGELVNNSLISGKTKVKLPKNGYVVFVGEKGTTFQVKMK
ncbi:MAG: serine hydrolase [bacterium]|nr:serine hydrolase [bacterium]